MTVYAADGFSSEYERLLDTAYLLSDEETDEINELLDELSERQKMDVTIATVDNLDGSSSIEACADDLYDYCNFGYGEDRGWPDAFDQYGGTRMAYFDLWLRNYGIYGCRYPVCRRSDAGVPFRWRLCTGVPYLCSVL